MVLTGRVCDGEIEKPVGCRGHAESLCTDFEREQFTGHNPSVRVSGDREQVSKIDLRHWAPRGRKEVNVDAHERDCGALGG